MRVIRRILRALMLIISCGITVPVADGVVIMGSLLFLPLPAVLPAPKAVVQSQGSKIFTVDGQQIAEFKDVDLKIPVRPRTSPTSSRKPSYRLKTATSTSTEVWISGAARGPF